MKYTGQIFIVFAFLTACLVLLNLKLNKIQHDVEHLVVVMDMGVCDDK